MKKFIVLLCVVTLAWLCKLSYDFYQLSQQMTRQQQTLLQSEQRNDSLNDQLVALQRTGHESTAAPTVKNQRDKNPSTGLSPVFAIQQQLELVQFALQQHQFVYALEKLAQLDQRIDRYEIADSLKQSIHQAILQDQQNIQQFVLLQQTQQEHFAQMLQQLDQRFKLALKDQQLSPAKIQPQYFWQRWLQIDTVSHTAVNLDQRSLVLKETQLRMLLAKQAFLSGEYQTYQNMLEAVIQLLDVLPDTESQRIKQQVIKIKQVQIIAVPKLKTPMILG